MRGDGGSTRRWKVLLVTALGVFMGFLDATVVTIAFPDIEADFEDATRAGLSWVLNAYNIVFAALLVPAGRIADVVGLRRVFLAGLVLFVVASMLCGLAPSAEALVALRVLQAAGAALVMPSSLGLLLAEFPLAQRASAVGLWAAMAGVSAALGPPIGGLLLEYGDWRLVFYANVPLGAGALLYARRLLVEHRGDPGPLPDFVGVVLVTAGVGALALAIVQGRDWGWDDPAILASFAVAAALIPLVLVRSARHRAPVVDVRLLRVRSFAVANVGTLVFSTGVFAILFANVLFLTGVWEYSVLTAGLALMPTALVTGTVAGLAGGIADRRGQRVLIVPGGLIFAGAMLWYSTQVGTDPEFVREWLPGAIISGLGTGLAFPALSSAATAALAPAELGQGSAVNAMFRQVGAVLGVAIYVAILGTPSPADAPAAFDDGWRFIGAAGVGASIVALALGRVGQPQAGGERAVTGDAAEPAAG